MLTISLRSGLRLTGHLLACTAIVLVVLSWPQSLGGKVSYVRVDGHSMDPTLHTGDLAVLRSQSSYRVGDAVAYRIPRGQFGAGSLVIHRLVGGDGHSGFTTMGDNRTIVDEWHPRTEDILGRVRYVVPGAGTQFASLSQPTWLGALVGGLTALVLLPSSGAALRGAGRSSREAPSGDTAFLTRPHHPLPDPGLQREVSP